jgi:uncharacterized damage-inducible protein DinB
MTTPLSPKDALLVRLRATRQDVLDAIAGLSDDQFAHPMTLGGPPARDVLAHLLVWDWAKRDLIRQGLAGGTPAFVAMMADVDRTNDEAAAEWRDRPVADLLAAMQAEHAALVQAVAALTAAQLAQPAPSRGFGDPGDTLLTAIDGTAWHNAEHAAELAAWRATLG